MATGNYIPEKFYVGRQSRGQDSVLGFITPMTKDSSFQGRKKTVDKWSSSSLPKLEVENKAQKGFRVVNNVSRYSTSNVLWRVQHPRGFEIEISSGNFMHLIQECNIEEGEFMNPLLFVRCGKENYLTFDGSDVHSTAHTAADIEHKVPMKDIQLGDTILLKDGTKGEFYGGAHFVTTGGYGDYEFGKSVRRQVIKTTDHSGGDLWLARSSLHATKIVTKVQTPISKDAAYQAIEDTFKMQKKGTRFSLHDYGDIIGVFQKPAKAEDLEYTTRAITKKEFNQANTDYNSWRHVLVVNGEFYKKERFYSHYSNHTPPTGTKTNTSITCSKIEFGADKRSIVVDQTTATNTHSHWNNHTYNHTTEFNIEPANATSFEVIEVQRK